MLTTTHRQGTNIVEIEFEGALTAEAMKRCHDTLTAVVREHGSLRLLARYGAIDLHHVEPAAFWEDLKNTVLIPKLERCAIVADQAWVRAISDAVAPLLPGALRTYEPRQVSEARSWITN